MVTVGHMNGCRARGKLLPAHFDRAPKRYQPLPGLAGKLFAALSNSHFLVRRRQ